MRFVILTNILVLAVLQEWDFNPTYVHWREESPILIAATACSALFALLELMIRIVAAGSW